MSPVLESRHTNPASNRGWTLEVAKISRSDCSGAAAGALTGKLSDAGIGRRNGRASRYLAKQ